MSFVSFFNIWISYALQDFVTDYGVRKSVSLQQRNEYHNNYYKAYFERMADKIEVLDNKMMAEPILHNSQAESLSEFIVKYDESLIERFGYNNEDLQLNSVKNSMRM